MLNIKLCWLVLGVDRLWLVQKHVWPCPSLTAMDRCWVVCQKKKKYIIPCPQYVYAPMYVLASFETVWHAIHCHAFSSCANVFDKNGINHDIKTYSVAGIQAAVRWLELCHILHFKNAWEVVATVHSFSCGCCWLLFGCTAHEKVHKCPWQRNTKKKNYDALHCYRSAQTEITAATKIK